MRTTDALDYFKGSKSALARALDIDQSSVYGWGEYPPDKRQLQLEKITGLKAEPECLARVLGMDLKRATDRKKPKKGGQ